MKTIGATIKIIILVTTACCAISCNEMEIIPLVDVSTNVDTDAEGVIGGDGITPESMPDYFKSSYVDHIGNYDAAQTKDIVADFDAKSDSSIDQSAIFQSAIDNLSSIGGGVLTIPAGDYRIADIYMKSNVHILIDKDVTIYPVWDTEPASTTTNIFLFGSAKNDSGAAGKYVENCSLRCATDGDQFTVDFEVPNSTSGYKIRFAQFAYVKNFMISDANIIDDYSILCAINFSSDLNTTSEPWEINCATDGHIENCSISVVHPGYGLMQLHAAQNIWCENIYAKGGVTLRLETDGVVTSASGDAATRFGAHNIFGKNIGSENGRSAIMLSPHETKNGTVLMDGVWSKSSNFTVNVKDGFIESGSTGSSGYFANDSRIINIHSVYGEDAQMRKDYLYHIEPALYSKFRWEQITDDNVSTDNYKWLIGASCAAVIDGLLDTYEVEIEGIVTEGYKYNQNGILCEDSEEIVARQAIKSQLLSDWEEKYLE